MENLATYILPVIAFGLLTAGWAGVQLIAKRMGTKNHIDNEGGCCGACDHKDECSRTGKK